MTLRKYGGPRRNRIRIGDYSAVGNGVASDQSAFAAAVAASAALGGVPIILDDGKTYRLTATLTIANSNTVFLGGGKYVTTIYRDFTTGPTLRFAKSDGTAISAVGVEGVSFSHNTALTLGASNVAHVEFEAATNARLRNSVMYNVVEGIHLIGGNNIDINEVSISGDYALYASRFAMRSTYNPNASSGTARQATEVRMNQVWFSGPTVNGAGQGGFLNTLRINAAEAWKVQGYFGQGYESNVLIEQLSDNGFIGDLGFNNCYIDAADRNSGVGDGVIITGAAGDGSQVIQNVSFVGGTIKGQGGDGRDGIRVDGTNRGAVTYPQACVGLKVTGVTVAAWYRHGINLEGGKGTVIAGSSIKGNNYTNAGSGNGLVVGAATTGTTTTGNRIGGDAFDNSTTDYQIYGIEVKALAASYFIVMNDCRLNASGNLVSSTDGTWLLNQTDSGALNPSITEVNGLLYLGRRAGDSDPVLLLRPDTTPADYFEMIGAAAGGTLRLVASGSDTNIPVNIEPKGAADLRSTGGLKSVSATRGVGYAAGAGATATQLTNKATTVVMNNVCGEITMNNANLAAGASVSFTLTNSAVVATDWLDVKHASGGTLGAYSNPMRVVEAAGSALITVTNTSAGDLAEAIVLRINLRKGTTS